VINSELQWTYHERAIFSGERKKEEIPKRFERASSIKTKRFPFLGKDPALELWDRLVLF